MADRHVRFAEANTYYSPAWSLTSTPTANTPSPTYSNASLSSDDGPLTPPSFPSSLPGSAVNIHPSLAHHLYHTPAIQYDTIEHPSTASLVHHPPHSSRQELRSLLAEPATSPPVTSLKLVSNHLPFLITVTPTTPASPPYHGSPFSAISSPRSSVNPFVTVGDVLASIYHGLRTPISKTEFAKLGHSKAEEVTAAWQKRYRRLNNTREREAEKAKGVKRIDFLSGRTKYLGISPPKHGDMWVLHLA
ncbi:hypothetical protein PUNSTDRAFT_143878 [Punctularia strigosozonata HHB-11173 SS5]|uniref:uncharacterized protein n=1 Tax=Punctularia strigosozonata (strain HHB-11173) TaxID=741275 RepID=UPI0004416BD1|nr:uncharacterized protein PUNSTDRAFT_143878 [Punctularia strigosozonata HHB-11173 SS5]EIN08229.1 hypothetical protein PUNSTDRAFT_143878 [Punctularia strigosozonata HHB-11173 SS5]